MIDDKQDAGELLSRHIAELKYEDIPPTVVDVAKKSLVDTWGVCMAASGLATQLRGIAELFSEAGGRAESTVIGLGHRLPAWNAAFVNGALSHALDYDDQHDRYLCHPSAPVVTAVLALAERLGSVTGKDLIASIAVGQDVYIRLVGGLHCVPNMRHRALLQGKLAAAAACARLLDLDSAGALSALGIASCSAGGVTQLTISSASELRSMYNAFPARDGLLAALMAERGMGGIDGLFDGKFGIINAYFAAGSDRQSMLEGLGTVFPAEQVSYKPWPSCRYTHGYIEAALAVLAENGLTANDVEKVRVFVGSVVKENCEPVGPRRRPTTIMGAKFSVPFCVGIAMARGAVTLGDFAADTLHDPLVLKEVDKVEHIVDARFEQPHNLELAASLLEVDTASGQTYSKMVTYPSGHPESPLGWPELTEKFYDCARHSASPIPEDLLSSVVDTVRGLEDEESAGYLVQMAAQPKVASM